MAGARLLYPRRTEKEAERGNLSKGSAMRAPQVSFIRHLRLFNSPPPAGCPRGTGRLPAAGFARRITTSASSVRPVTLVLDASHFVCCAARVIPAFLFSSDISSLLFAPAAPSRKLRLTKARGSVRSLYAMVTDCSVLWRSVQKTKQGFSRYVSSWSLFFCG